MAGNGYYVFIVYEDVLPYRHGATLLHIVAHYISSKLHCKISVTFKNSDLFMDSFESQSMLMV